jgi:hypothetical protein
VVQEEANHIPVLGLKKPDEMGPDEPLGAGDQSSVRHTLGLQTIES